MNYFDKFGNSAISMTALLLSGNLLEAARLAFVFGMLGGFIGANVAGSVTHEKLLYL